MLFEIIAALAVITLWIFASLQTALWITGVVTDVNKHAWLMTVLDVAIPPLGVVRGMLIWFAAEKIQKGSRVQSTE